MEPWKLLAFKLVLLLLSIIIGGYALLWVVELIQRSWKSNNWKKKWYATSVVVGLYLTLNGWFYHLAAPWKVLVLKFVSFALFTVVGGFGLLRFVELIEKAWKSDNRKKKWFTMSAVVAIYLALKSWFQ